MFDDLADRSANGIAAEVRRLVAAGALQSGERLPTVRTIARSLGVSPTTVSEAWRALARAGVVATHGRNGTVVLGVPDPVFGPRRYRQVTGGAGRFAVDLSLGTPDPQLLPDLRVALARVSSRDHVPLSYVEAPVLDQLAVLLRQRWPFVADALTVVDGAMDALDRIASVRVHHGDRVLVERVTFPPLLDLLEQLGAVVIGLECDDEGVVPSSLERELQRGPTAIFLQPRAHNPTGVSMTPSRARDLARVLTRESELRPLVVEDDHSGAVASAEAVSLGRWYPHVVHVLGFSKSHGPDLRLAAIGGDAAVVEAVATRRMLGPGWSSRLLQGVLADLLSDDATDRQVELARREYARRGAVLRDALRSVGVEASASDGINMWVAVPRERDALLALASRGIGAAPGSPFSLDGSVGSEHIRVTIAALPGDEHACAALCAEIADALASTTHGWSRPS